jgi:hypothetical protein
MTRVVRSARTRPSRTRGVRLRGRLAPASLVELTTTGVHVERAHFPDEVIEHSSRNGARLRSQQNPIPKNHNTALRAPGNQRRAKTLREPTEPFSAGLALSGERNEAMLFRQLFEPESSTYVAT